MKAADRQTGSAGIWQTTKVPNLVRDTSSGVYYARFRINGKLVWRSLETEVYTTAKLKLPILSPPIKTVLKGDSLRALHMGLPSASGANLYANINELFSFVGTQVIDISTPTQPRWVATSYHGSWSLAFTGNHFLVCGWRLDANGGQRGRLDIIEHRTSMPDPLRATVVTTATPNNVALGARHAYVADGEAGLRVVDITDPASPRRVGGYPTLGYARGVALSGQYAYVAEMPVPDESRRGTSGGALLILDVTDPANRGSNGSSAHFRRWFPTGRFDHPGGNIRLVNG